MLTILKLFLIADIVNCELNNKIYNRYSNPMLINDALNLDFKKLNLRSSETPGPNTQNSICSTEYVTVTSTMPVSTITSTFTDGHVTITSFSTETFSTVMSTITDHISVNTTYTSTSTFVHTSTTSVTYNTCTESTTCSLLIVTVHTTLSPVVTQTKSVSATSIVTSTPSTTIFKESTVTSTVYGTSTLVATSTSTDIVTVSIGQCLETTVTTITSSSSTTTTANPHNRNWQIQQDPSTNANYFINPVISMNKVTEALVLLQNDLKKIHERQSVDLQQEQSKIIETVGQKMLNFSNKFSEFYQSRLRQFFVDQKNQLKDLQADQNQQFIFGFTPNLQILQRNHFKRFQYNQLALLKSFQAANSHTNEFLALRLIEQDHFSQWIHGTHKSSLIAHQEDQLEKFEIFLKSKFNE